MITEYTITHLGDIFNLPTIEQMKTCLAELSEAMILARTANDSIMEILKEAGAVGVTRALEWPKESLWTDDSKGEVGFTINFPEFEN